MADVTVPFGFELPIEGELFSTALVRRNFQLTNDELKSLKESKLEIKQDTSGYQTTAWNARSSSFTRISIGDTGIVIAKIAIQINNTQSIGTPGYTYLLRDDRPSIPEHDRWVIPPGFGSKAGMYPNESSIAGNGVNQNIQLGVSVRDIGFRRSTTGTPTSFTTNTNMYLNFSYQWDGLET